MEATRLVGSRSLVEVVALFGIMVERCLWESTKEGPEPFQKQKAHTGGWAGRAIQQCPQERGPGETCLVCGLPGQYLLWTASTASMDLQPVRPRLLG